MRKLENKKPLLNKLTKFKVLIVPEHCKPNNSVVSVFTKIAVTLDVINVHLSY